MRAVAVVLLLALAGAAQAGGLVAPAGPLLRSSGILEALQGTGAPAPMDVLVNYSCGGTAPVTTACEQVIEAAGAQGFSLYLVPGTGFTGTLVGTLADGDGHSVSLACTFLAFVGGVSPAPQCHVQDRGPLHAGTLRLVGAVPQGGDVSAGYWEVRAELH